MANKNILLVEPSYKNKYPPLGLMKIAQYHGPNGKGDIVRFIKLPETTSVSGTAWDRVYITTLFSFEFARISQAIDFALRVVGGDADRIFVGGIAASLMHSRFLGEPRWRGIRFVRGLLDRPPALSLGLDQFSEELYADDVNGTPIEDLVPDYSILNQVQYKYPVINAYFLYATRGCVRKCSFCGVPALEGAQRDTTSIRGVVESIDRLYGPKKDLILMDNNIVASSRFHEIIAEIRDLGFVPGAKFKSGRVAVQRRVDFNQGVDARILCKDRAFLKELSTVCIDPLRIAFDHFGLRGPYERAVRYAHEVGLKEMSNYMLYNFHDSPADLFERMRLNLALNEELGLRIWSFPMRYQPIDRPDRSFVGERWTKYQLRSLQLILQATHGVVSGDPDFFKRAFGDTVSEFESLLMRPHHFIFNRDWYERYDGRGEFDEYQRATLKLGASDRLELVGLLSSCDASEIETLPKRANNKALRSVLSFYVPLSKAEEAQVWRQQKAMKQHSAWTRDLDEERRVEDAGLEDDDGPCASSSKQPVARRAAASRA